MWTWTVDRGSWIVLSCSSNSSSSRCLCLIFFGLWSSSLPRLSLSSILISFLFCFFLFWRTLDQLGKLVLRPLLLAFASRRSKYLKPQLWPELHDWDWRLEGRRRLCANASAWMSNETDERPQCAVAAPAPAPSLAATLSECVCTNYALLQRCASAAAWYWWAQQKKLFVTPDWELRNTLPKQSEEPLT